ncbi:MAG: polyribonucleotide nucleotidyltransferase [Candidatus Pacebacteria bacterium]|nr:polyribonucleotide nucleotidyltransferase [Candidatus Paceibacterota bacterium]PIR60983.1 MAG: polyribonucleotide nucleotidyltransferase [Candidatus Pacebacteria bacterium CG10_big_fil_rev_8_21_14_0_10_45_6]
MAYPDYSKTYKTTIALGDKEIFVEIGKFSEQVAGAVITRMGDTVVHTTVALGRKVNLGYFPLSVEFAEKLYSAGIIKGSRWVKRDGRPLDDTVLKARVIDRSLRPLFPDGVTNEVQVISTVFSYDGENEPDMLGLLGSTIGLAISQIPFNGPLAGARIAYSKETKQYIFNPTQAEQAASDLDLIVSGTGDAIVMVEAGASEVSEAVVLEGMLKAQAEFAKVCKQIAAIAKEIGKEKVELVTKDEAAEARKATLVAHIEKKYEKPATVVVAKDAKLEPSGFAELVTQIAEEQPESEVPFTEGEISSALSSITKQIARTMIIEDKIRPDGRKTDEIRPIWCEVDVFPRTHGSAMFKRGATQAVTITTLGAPSLGQLIESIKGEETRHYMHHYNMPPYASGEAGRFGFPKRREIGHGALAERALLPMIPSQEEFPYAIHVVSEIMSSNGSTSQASVCGSTLSLMAAGVPLKRPVAGIAMGLMSDGKTYVVLSDIQGLEDHVGDMDFKVAGTTEGITAIQMDIKLTGIPREVLEQALEQARLGRLHILGEMNKCLAAPRAELSQYAPKIEQITIPGDRIGELIGPGGKNIKALIERTGCEINVDEDKEKQVGIVSISSPDQAAISAAKTAIENMFREIHENDEFDGTVTRVEDYGCFVEFLPGREGLVHVSAMSTEFVPDAHEKVAFGDSLHVRVSEIKEDGKIGLSLLSAEEQAAARSNRPQGRPPFRGGRPGGGDRRGGGSNSRDRYDRR